MTPVLCLSKSVGRFVREVQLCIENTLSWQPASDSAFCVGSDRSLVCVAAGENLYMSFCQLTANKPEIQLHNATMSW
jgi:hypothetical protein